MGFVRLTATAVRSSWLVLLLAVLVGGCAALSTGKPEEIVRQRAQARWNALLQGDFSTAYEYMSPSYRAVVEKKRYANQFGGGAAWESAEVISVSCEAERCTVRMKVGFRPVIGVRPGKSATTHFDETWVREDGQWWMFQNL